LNYLHTVTIKFSSKIFKRELVMNDSFRKCDCRRGYLYLILIYVIPYSCSLIISSNKKALSHFCFASSDYKQQDLLTKLSMKVLMYMLNYTLILSRLELFTQQVLRFLWNFLWPWTPYCLNNYERKCQIDKCDSKTLREPDEKNEQEED
jgi:hypothetical protein